MFAIFKAYSFGSFEVMGMTLQASKDGPQRFIPLFDTREQAIKFNDGSEEHIFQMEVMPT